MRLGRSVVIVLVLASMFGASTASAADVTMTATVLPGTRSLTTATLGTLASVLRAASTSATLTVAVTESATNGVNPWSVTARLCGPNNITTPTAADCTTYPDQMVLTGDATKTIAGSAVTISSRAVTPSGGGGTSTATTGSETMVGARTIFTNTGQATATLYTGTYSSTSTITVNPPSNATAGAYNGFLVVTLVG